MGFDWKPALDERGVLLRGGRKGPIVRWTLCSGSSDVGIARSPRLLVLILRELSEKRTA